VRQLDLYLFHLVNGWAGTRPLDQLVAFAERHLLFRALPLLPYWWLWFAGEGRVYA
jgi:hypothetical protein